MKLYICYFELENKETIAKSVGHILDDKNMSEDEIKAECIRQFRKKHPEYTFSVSKNNIVKEIPFCAIATVYEMNQHIIEDIK
jgi:hypothetical protein